MFGTVALVILIMGYVLLLFEREKLFLLFNSVASLLFVIHAIQTDDMAILLANAFIGSILFGTLLKKLWRLRKSTN